MPFDLIGLEVSSFRNPGTRPLHFTIARERADSISPATAVTITRATIAASLPTRPSRNCSQAAESAGDAHQMFALPAVNAAGP